MTIRARAGYSRGGGYRIKAATNDRLKIEVYSGRKKVKTSTFYSSTESLTLRSAGKWKKGTYHIRVYRGNSRS